MPHPAPAPRIDTAPIERPSPRTRVLIHAAHRRGYELRRGPCESWVLCRQGVPTARCRSLADLTGYLGLPPPAPHPDPICRACGAAFPRRTHEPRKGYVHRRYCGLYCRRESLRRRLLARPQGACRSGGPRIATMPAETA